MNGCDICKKPLGLIGKFKYADGWICKDCYKKASKNFTETITRKSLDEIKKLCSQQRDEESYGNFVITGKIGNYLLIDEKHQRICIPNNRIARQEATEPEFYDLAEVKGSKIKYHPYMEQEELEKKIAIRRDTGVINHLEVCITMKNGKEKDICFILKPVRIKSYAFRQSYLLAKRMNEEINRLAADDNFVQ